MYARYCPPYWRRSVSLRFSTVSSLRSTSTTVDQGFHSHCISSVILHNSLIFVLEPPHKPGELYPIKHSQSKYGPVSVSHCNLLPRFFSPQSLPRAPPLPPVGPAGVIGPGGTTCLALSGWGRGRGGGDERTVALGWRGRAWGARSRSFGSSGGEGEVWVEGCGWGEAAAGRAAPVTAPMAPPDRRQVTWSAWRRLVPAPPSRPLLSFVF